MKRAIVLFGGVVILLGGCAPANAPCTDWSLWHGCRGSTSPSPHQQVLAQQFREFTQAAQQMVMGISDEIASDSELGPVVIAVAPDPPFVTDIGVWGRATVNGKTWADLTRSQRDRLGAKLAAILARHVASFRLTTSYRGPVRLSVYDDLGFSRGVVSDWLGNVSYRL